MIVSVRAAVASVLPRTVRCMQDQQDTPSQRCITQRLNLDPTGHHMRYNRNIKPRGSQASAHISRQLRDSSTASSSVLRLRLPPQRALLSTGYQRRTITDHRTVSTQRR
jgi:hypothetical protein